MVFFATLTASSDSKMRKPSELDELDAEQARKMKAAKEKLDVPLQSHPVPIPSLFLCSLPRQTQTNKGAFAVI